jgi:hypothetical protein
MSHDKKDKGREGNLFANRPSWVDKAGLLVAVASVAVAVIALTRPSGSNSSEPSSKAPPRLEVVDLRVRDILAERKNHARMEITLHNTGERLVVIHGVRFEIEHVYELPRCASQGDLALTNVYGVALPRNAQPEDMVNAPLHQQVGPDEADRFGIDISTERSHTHTAVDLFELEVSLLHDGSATPLSLGKVLVSLPEMPSRGEYYWGRGTGAFLRQWAEATPGAIKLWRSSMPCWRSNTAILRRALARRSVRSSALDDLATELATPSLAALE